MASLGFLLASFPARNSDLWAHLAAGRDLAGGPLVSGWLFDWLCYGLYSLAGGPGLVLAKAFLVVLLALLVLRLSHYGQGAALVPFSPVVCTALVLLTISTRLLAQPATVSYLCLALSLWLSQPKSTEHPSWLASWPLLVLFGLWANLDGWFVLGLAVVALAWVGWVLDQGRPGRRAIRPLLLSLLVLGAACLLNPAHVRAFALPPELGALAGVDATGTGDLGRATAGAVSPFDSRYLAGLRLSPANAAYFPLLALGLASFLLNAPRCSWQRLLPWGALALLGAAQSRLIPFFAIIAGPVLAWNLEDFAARRLGTARRLGPIRSAPVMAFRALAIGLGVTCLVCAWPGWLQGPPYEPRRWDVEAPPSLEQGAHATRRWHQEGKLSPNARGLHLSPETANAFAWFCPEEKAVLAPALARAVRGEPDAPPDWRARLRRAGIDHVIVYETDGGRLYAALQHLLADPDEWSLLYLEGYLAVFGWRDRAGSRTDAFGSWGLDLDRLAFGPPVGRTAPPQQPQGGPERRQWWEAFYRPAPPRPVDRDEATFYLLLTEAMKRGAPRRHRAVWKAMQGTALVGSAATWTVVSCPADVRVCDALLRPGLSAAAPPARTGATLDQVALASWQRFAMERDDAPPASLYLAIRAARRALVVNPQDARAYLVLGESYVGLLHSTRERAWALRLKPLVQLRRAQASAALNQALARDGGLALAHLNLTWLYREMGYLDLAVSHLREHRKLVRAAGPPPELGADEFRQLEDRYDEELGRLTEVVAQQQQRHAAEAARLRVLDRAGIALQMGLAGKARDTLLASDIAAFGRQGMSLELELLLRTGQPHEVQEWLDEKQEAVLGTQSYHWIRAQALAALGDYARAEQELSHLASGGRAPGSPGPREAIALMIGQATLDEQPLGSVFPIFPWRALSRLELRDNVLELAQRLRKEANATVLSGLLALEEGRVREAATAFRAALALWNDQALTGLDFEARPVAQRYLGLLAGKEQAP